MRLERQQARRLPRPLLPRFYRRSDVVELAGGLGTEDDLPMNPWERLDDNDSEEQGTSEREDEGYVR